jgi:hypothetical protein
MASIVARICAFAFGFVVVQATLRSAVLTVVVPRGEPTRLTRETFLVMRGLYDFFSRNQRTVESRERTFARFGPTSLLALALLWVMGTVLGFVPMFWAAGVHDLRQCFYLSGSAITTLGVRAPSGGFESALAYAEAIIGLGIVALLISYLPTIYTLFSRREAEVVKLDVRAGSPPTALEMLNRYQRIGWLDHLDETWLNWEAWFSELEESHTSHPVLVFFRSQRLNSSWITCAGAVLDTTAVIVSSLKLKNSPQAAVTLRSGFMALGAIAKFYGVASTADIEANAPISIYREEFLLLFDDLAARGLPMKDDREQAWRDFAGWRVNYDEPLLALCALCAAPATPWSSDRIERFQRPTFFHQHWRIDPPDTPPSW